MFRIDCCLLALAGMVCNIIGLGIYAGYNIKLKDREAKLEKRTQKLEQKNGKELAEIAKLKEEVRQLKDRQKTLGGFYSKSILKEQNNDHDK
jgi:hypothetical protein